MPKSTENTVFVRFVPTPTYKVMRHELEDIFSQIGPIKKSSWINSRTGGDHAASKGYGFVKYVSQEDAETATNDLHNTDIQMEGQPYTLKVELASLGPQAPKKEQPPTKKEQPPPKMEQLPPKMEQPPKQEKPNQEPNFLQSQEEKEPEKEESKPETTSAEEEALLKKKSRIILRNLSFYAKENHIRKAMEENFGKVADVHLPRVQSNLHVGFCFVTFQNPKDAHKAVKAKHVDVQKRKVNMDWSLPKKLHQQRQQEEKNQKNMNAKTEIEKDPADEVSDNEAEKDMKNDNNESGSEDDGSGSDDDGSIKDESDDAEPTFDDSVGQKRTLFLRNLPFDTTRHDLFALFHKFGYIDSIYLVRDKESGMLKGTAFVTYSKPQSAERAMQQASLSSSSQAANEAASAFVSQRQATTSSSEDPAQKGASSLLLKGRKMLVDFAVDKETASTFDSKEHNVPAADRRNMYLQAEARVESSSTEPNANNANTWDDIPEQDQKKRQTALKDKTSKLQSPIFFINPHRLSFRNLGKHIDEAGLQRLLELSTKRGIEKGLVSAKDQIAHWRAIGDLSTRDILSKVQGMEANGESIIPQWDAKVHIKEYFPSVFIDRDYGGTGKKSKAPSRGFGFAEFTHHTHALACLRELNNNSAYSKEYTAGGRVSENMKNKAMKGKVKGGKGNGGGDYVGEDGRVRLPRLVVDFAVENKVKAKKQAERRLHQQMNQAKQQAEKPKAKLSEEDKAKKRSRGSLQREKKRQKRESGEEEAERQKGLQRKALAEARKELRLEKKAELEAKKKIKTVKPPKKKKKVDKDDARMDKFERSTLAPSDEKVNPRAVVNDKRWFE